MLALARFAQDVLEGRDVIRRSAGAVEQKNVGGGRLRSAPGEED